MKVWLIVIRSKKWYKKFKRSGLKANIWNPERWNVLFYNTGLEITFNIQDGF